MTRYLSARAVSTTLSLPWSAIEPDLEAHGAEILRINGRIRVNEDDVAALIARSRKPTLAEATQRADLVLELALEQIGHRRKT